MKKAAYLTAFLLLFCIGVPAVVAVVAQPVLLQDVQQRGSNLSYFEKTKSVLLWNFKRGGATYDSTHRALVVGAQTAEFNPDLGAVQAQTGLQTGTSTAKPTCDSAHHGEFYTVLAPGSGSDAGDTTFMCCQIAGTYAWQAGYCK